MNRLFFCFLTALASVAPAVWAGSDSSGGLPPPLPVPRVKMVRSTFTGLGELPAQSTCTVTMLSVSLDAEWVDAVQKTHTFHKTWPITLDPIRLDLLARGALGGKLTVTPGHPDIGGTRYELFEQPSGPSTILAETGGQIVENAAEEAHELVTLIDQVCQSPN